MSTIFSKSRVATLISIVLSFSVILCSGSFVFKANANSSLTEVCVVSDLRLANNGVNRYEIAQNIDISGTNFTSGTERQNLTLQFDLYAETPLYVNGNLNFVLYDSSFPTLDWTNSYDAWVAYDDTTGQTALKSGWNKVTVNFYYGGKYGSIESLTSLNLCIVNNSFADYIHLQNIALISKPLQTSVIVWTPSGNTSYYVDNTNGNDSNDGLTTLTPWKTLSKVSSTTFYNGDTINLKCGEVWNESLTLNGQGTGASPITVKSYGTGNKPKIRSSADTVVGGTNLGGWTVKGLAIECTTTNTINIGGQNTGIQFTYDGTASYSDVIITDNEIFATGIDTNSQGIRIITLSSYENNTRVLTNLTINNNLVYNVGWLGIATTGWNLTAGRDMFSTNSYGNVCVNGNTIHNTACQGITIHSANTGTIKWNLVYNCGLYAGTAVSWGTSGIWVLLASNFDIKYNEVYGQSESSFTNYDASGFDIDWTCDRINLQYNYAHDNKGPGIETMANTNCTIMNNKISNNNGLSNVGNGQITLSSFTGNPEAMTGLTNLNISKNLILVNKANTVALCTNLITAGTWSGNTFSNNNIVCSNLLTNTKIYDIRVNTTISTANNNNIYSSNGTAFKGTKYGTTYSTISAWRTATGLDLNSVTAKSETGIPTALTNLNGSQGTGLVVNLTWTASTDSGRGISHYNVYRSTSSTFTPAYTNMVGESTTTSFSDSDGLASGVTYYYKVIAEDKCGNVGTAGNKTVSIS